MTQGQVCKIESNTEQAAKLIKRAMKGSSSGWFMKLRNEDGAVNFYLVDGRRECEMIITASQVDDSMRNLSPDKEYRVVFVLPIDHQVAATRISPSVETDAICENNKRHIDIIKNKIKNINDRNAEIRKECYRNEDTLIRLSEELERASWVSEHIKFGIYPEYHYAFGIHPNDAKKTEYCWGIPECLANKVVVGQKVVVETKYGESAAVITKISKTPFFTDHLMVKGIIKD